MENKNCCTGCGACYNICPKNAIKMVQNTEGFYVPEIDKNLCINCGLCERVCPPYYFQSDNYKGPEVYSVVNNDEQQRFNSSSGGVFPMFAQYVISNGGVVFGVAWDENFKAHHIKASTIDELDKLYSSKYVQSNTERTYSEAKECLQQDKLVLFTGTPCQIAGLKSFLQRDYKNLITVEVICHGVPSPKVFEEYLNLLNRKDKIININFRAKDRNWGQGKILKIYYDKSKIKLIEMKNSSYLKLFGHGFSMNKSCFSCKFNKIPRVADITIGDFWGVDEYNATLNDEKGISIAIINNNKGEQFFNTFNNLCTINKIPLDIAIKKNHNIIQPTKEPQLRADFFRDFLSQKYTLDKLSKKYIVQYPLILRLFYRLMPKYVKDIVKSKLLNK